MSLDKIENPYVNIDEKAEGHSTEMYEAGYYESKKLTLDDIVTESDLPFWMRRANESDVLTDCFMRIYRRMLALCPNFNVDTLLIVALLAMILTSTIDSVLYTRLSYKMVNYEWFLSQIVITIGFCAISWPVVIYKWFIKRSISGNALMHSHIPFFSIAILDGLSGLLGTIPTPYIPGPMLVVIGKVGIPFTMLCSYIFLKVRYRPTHYIGALMIGIGVIVSVFPKLDDKETFDSNVIWMLIYISAGIPTAFSNVYKEKILKSGDGSMDIWFFNAWVAFYQLFVGISLAWTIFLPFPPPAKHVSFSEFLPYMENAMMCFLGHTDSNINDGACSFSWLVFCFFIIFNVAFNVLIFYVMKRGSATLAVIASTTTLALTSLGYHIPLLAGVAKVGTFDIYGVISLIVIILAVLVYKIHDEIPRKTDTIDIKEDEDEDVEMEEITHSG